MNNQNKIELIKTTIKDLQNTSGMTQYQIKTAGISIALLTQYLDELQSKQVYTINIPPTTETLKVRLC